MGKTVLFRLFGLGRIPPALLADLEGEGIVVQDEGVGGWLVERNLVKPGRRSLYRVSSFTGFLAVTRKRILAQTYWTAQLDQPVNDPRVSALHVAFPKANRLTLAFDYNTFRPDWHGQVELRFNTAQASRFYDTLAGLGAQADGAGLSVQRGLR